VREPDQNESVLQSLKESFRNPKDIRSGSGIMGLKNPEASAAECCAC